MSQKYNHDQKTYVVAGEKYKILCPYSEVCCHMRLADRLMLAELKVSPEGYRSVQLYNEDDSIYSFPITVGEAGFYEDEGGIYYYPPAERHGYEWGARR